MIKVLIADQQEIAREGIKAVLETYDGFELAGEVNSSDEALVALDRLDANVLIVDFVGLETKDIAALRSIVRGHPYLAIFILTNDANMARARRAISLGVLGYLKKDTELLTLATGLRRVAAGFPCIDNDLTDNLISRFWETSCTLTLHKSLSSREYEVFLRLAEGETYLTIAQGLGISVKTIATHKARIFDKLQIGNMSSLVQYAIRNELLADQYTVKPPCPSRGDC